MREKILSEIRRVAAANGGASPGVRTFERETGISQSAWRGVYWARWGDAVREAGLEPNTKQGRLEEGLFFTKLVEACLHFGRFPTAMELRMYKKIDTEIPSVKSITKQFGSLANAPHRLSDWAKIKGNYPDLVALLAPHLKSVQYSPEELIKEGMVYLLHSGSHYKIGRSDQIERRVKEIRVTLPESMTLIHAIRTDDPAGIEAYWHRRFAERRARGEWFKLTSSDVAAFKRRKFQ